jgi:hypothetical protein
MGRATVRVFFEETIFTLLTFVLVVDSLFAVGDILLFGAFTLGSVVFQKVTSTTFHTFFKSTFSRICFIVGTISNFGETSYVVIALHVVGVALRTFIFISAVLSTVLHKSSSFGTRPRRWSISQEVSFHTFPALITLIVVFFTVLV